MPTRYVGCDENVHAFACELPVCTGCEGLKLQPTLEIGAGGNELAMLALCHCATECFVNSKISVL